MATATRTKKKAAATAPAATTATPTNPILAQLSAPAFLTLDTDSVTLNRQNPATNRDDDASLAELVASIQQHGVLQPAIARGGVLTDEPPLKVELVAGERRWRACAKLGIPLPVMVYRASELTDERALEVALVENLQRRDQTPTDESRAYAVLQTRYNMTLEDIAAHVGRSLAHVHRRLSLNGLAPELQDMLNRGWLTIGAAEHFARLVDFARQRTAVREAAYRASWSDLLEDLDKGRIATPRPADPSPADEPITAAEARAAVERTARDLADAPWDLGDAELVPGCGACNACPKRTGAQTSMFGGVNADVGDQCLDRTCWDGKVAAHTERAVERAKQDGATVLSKKESAMLYAGGRQLRVSTMVDLDAQCEIPGKRGTWRTAARSILREVPQSVAVDGDGLAHTLVERDVLLKAARSSGLIKAAPRKERTADDARRANELAEARRARALEDAVLDRALDAAVSTDTDGWSCRVWELIARRVCGRALHESKRELARRLSRTDDVTLKASDMDGRWLELFASPDSDSKREALVRLVLELCMAGPDYGFLGKGLEEDDGLSARVAFAASVFKVNVGACRKLLDTADDGRRRGRAKSDAAAKKGRGAKRGRPARGRRARKA